MTHTSLTRSKVKSALNPNICFKRKVPTRKRETKSKWFIKYVESNDDRDLTQMPDNTVSDDTDNVDRQEKVETVKNIKLNMNTDDLESECSSSDASW
jgi:hypothetical protein